MAKSKKSRKPNPNSPFWHPKKVGEVKEGTFVEFQSTLMGGAILLSSGLVGLSYVLKSAFRPVAASMKAGAKVKIEFTGKSGRTLTYKVWLNGKELPTSNFQGITDKAELAAMMTAKK